MNGPTYFDLDGVLVDFVEVFRDAASRVLGQEPQVRHEDTYDLRDQLGLSVREYERVWRSPEIVEALLRAPLMNHDIESMVGEGPHVFITARGTSELECDHADMIRLATRTWLRRMIPGDYSPVYFVEASGKADLARSLGCRAAVEDAPSTVEELLARGIPVAMPVYGYNAHLAESHPLITTLRGWREPNLRDLLAV